jgi:3',5'-cyclic AMP phosphodiesterase CpdA
VLGDGGEGNVAIYDVASATHTVCARRGCDFVLYLGDNFYDNGVTSVADTQFQTKFEMPFAEVDLPFYVVLGNHDYGGLGSGITVDWDRGAYEIAYSTRSTKWTMPAAYYDFEVANAQFLALDTTAIKHEEGYEAKEAWLEGAMSGSRAPWRIGFGHHPYISNGDHGNAGDYQGALDVGRVLDGVHLKAFFDDHVCGDFDVYFAGHDHTRQWLGTSCGTIFAVSGAAAKVTHLHTPDRNPVAYEDDTEPGFLWVEIDGDRLTAAFYDSQANLDFSTVVTRPSAGVR